MGEKDEKESGTKQETEEKELLEEPVTEKRSKKKKKTEKKVPEWEKALKDRKAAYEERNSKLNILKQRILKAKTEDDLNRYEERLIRYYKEVAKLNGEVYVFHNNMEEDIDADEEYKVSGKKSYKGCLEGQRDYASKHIEVKKSLLKRRKSFALRAKYKQKDSKTSSLMKLIQTVKTVNNKKELEKREDDPVKKYEKGSELYDKAEENFVDPAFSVHELVASSKDLKDYKKGKKDKYYNPWEKSDDEGVFEKISGVKGWLDSAKQAFDMLKDVVKMIGDFDDMSASNKLEAVINLLTSGGDFVIGLLGNVADALKAVPGIGLIIGLLKNVYTFFTKGVKIYLTQKRMNALREKKKALKEKMKKRKEKAAKAGIQLYEFLNSDGKIDKEKLGTREKRGLNGDAGGAVKQRMNEYAPQKSKAKDKTKDKTVYYWTKEQESIQQYDEMKEVLHKNKNSRRAIIIDLVHEGVDLVGNIAGMFPGYGGIVQTGLSVLNTGVKIGGKIGSKAVQWGKNIAGSDRSTKNKKKFRAKYAEHLYEHMLDISKYTDIFFGEHFAVDNVDDYTIKHIDESYTYVKTMLEGMNVYMPDLIASETRPELINKLAEGFENS